MTVLKVMIIFVMVSFLSGWSAFAQPAEKPGKNIIALPAPSTTGTLTVEKAIFNRKSVRDYKKEALTLQEVSQLLWAAGGATVDGVTGPTRAYASAGGIYPLEIYLVAGKVTGLESGVYHYIWDKHSLELVKKGDVRGELSKAAYDQVVILNAPASIVVTAIYSKTTQKYGSKGATNYVPMDTGHLGENVHLEAESLGLGTVMLGAFVEDRVSAAIGVKGEEVPMYVMPVGRPA